MIRCSAIRHCCDLHVADHGEKGFEAAGYIALHDLDVVEIEQQFQVRFANLADDICGLARAVQKVSGCVVVVQRLDQDRCRVTGFIASIVQVFTEGTPGTRATVLPAMTCTAFVEIADA